MEEKLWRFSDNFASFTSNKAHQFKTLYFPLANEKIMSSVASDLHGDIKVGEDSFLLTPVSRIDLVDSHSSRNFWIYMHKNKFWSATGVSQDLSRSQNDRFQLEAGLLWHKITRENRGIGLRAEILSFVPAGNEPVEIMRVTLTNILRKSIKFIPTAAIPIYARGAGNIRDHRQVTSLLQRITLHKFGVMVKPTLSFDEAGHRPNQNIYFVLGWDERFGPPQYIYPTQEMFCGDSGDLEAPVAVFKNILPKKDNIQGKETMGALRFKRQTLAPGKSYSYIIVMGISQEAGKIKNIIHKFKRLKQVEKLLDDTKKFWIDKSSEISSNSQDSGFDNWFRWVSIQPTLRRIFGCSFLPDFDYGKGGRGWRDLWQDCLGIILSNPQAARNLLLNNFAGVRIDGSNATIIGKGAGGFISDRNNIARVWMDHGVWPLLTLDLYLNETGDFSILREGAAYFYDHQIHRAGAIDQNWESRKIYRGSILEHLLVQHLVQFFNVGAHNHVRLEGADWNDGLDMAGENGESVAFSAMYAHNLNLLAKILKRLGIKQVKAAKELKILLSKVDYKNIKAKQRILSAYFKQTQPVISGEKVDIDAEWLASDLEDKSAWMANHIRRKEWLRDGFFNGYYDNKKRRVEGKYNNIIRMMLQSQVFPIMGDVATDEQVKHILKSARKYLWDKELKGYHLNTDFGCEEPDLGRAFSFVYGEKENGAYFNHMIVMLAYALYKRGFIKEGWQALKSVYEMAVNTPISKIYPCLPEYFNLEGRGMYSYLTGSASWFVLTLLTQVFGIRGLNGDLLIEPKLLPEHFHSVKAISINRNFAGKRLKISFANPKKLKFGKYKIISATLNSSPLPLQETRRLIISRKTILGLPANKINRLNIVLG